MNARILVVDDEREIADLVELYLVNEGFSVVKCYDGESARREFAGEEFDLAILDVMLPDADGFALCREIRKTHIYPIIMLTAKVETTDKIGGLAIGADDYVTKPFNPVELLARVKSQLRRYRQYNGAGEPEEIKEYHIRGLSISKECHQCSVNGELLSLTPIEFGVIWYLCAHQGKVVSSEELYEAVWGERYLNSNNTVMAHIARIREKMHEQARNPKIIQTVWGVGYTIA
ncbi:MAG: VanR-ABDEGLN family response regulator transcription factor [Muribaculaceae bacterium]|nr:VanR-ABDEGLN family response regulator transcription factor [Roseburia sp.]MCM1431754.1 VanR-ABDEGLN family response regulator transcription factor [Muribaculaceae bacterium]MCM1493380.1 VanR-ABDEGLN family response regulator transcription factor [Muribaculaceae bacterium]